MFQKFRHLHPGLEHLPSVDPLNGGAFEDDIVYEIESDWVFRNTQKRSASAGPQHLEALMNRDRMATHLEEDVNAGAVCRFQNARYDVALIGVEGFVSSHFLGELSPVRIDLCGENHRAAARTSHSDRH